MKAPGIYANSTSLFDLVERRSRIFKVAGGFGFVGAAVFSRLGFLLFSDLNSEKIHKWMVNPWEEDVTRGNLSVFREMSNRSDGLTFDHQGRLLVGETSRRRITRTEKNGSITVLAREYEGKRLNSPSDLVYGIDGSIYFSDMPPYKSREIKEQANSPAIYRIARSQIPGQKRLQKVSEECQLPSGIALAPQQNLLYIADADLKNIRVQKINPNGTLAKGSLFVEFPSDTLGNPRGLKTDELGNLYSAGPGGLIIFCPNGKHLGTIITPEEPLNCCWGRGFQGLYITTQTSVYYVKTKVLGTRTF